MASILELLEALNTKGAAVSTTDLAKELQSSNEGVLKQLTREKDKGNVEGDSQDGWLISEKGRIQLEKGEIRPTMLEEGVTPRQQFEAIGRLIGLRQDRIVLAADIVWSGDYNDVKWAWEALGQADIADDLRSVWVNAWRAKLHKGIPPELETELTGVSKAVGEAEESGAPSKLGGRDYVIHDDEPVRVGANLGDYSLQDAKDILAIRALRGRFSGVGQAGTGQGAAVGAGGTAEKVSDLLRELSPYLTNKGSDDDKLREVIALQMELQKQEILAHIPPPGQPTQPKSFIEQLTDLTTGLGSLREIGPMLRSILGVPETSSGNPPATALPVQFTDSNGNPVVMDLSHYISLEKFKGEERRAEERHSALVGLAQTVRENFSDGVSALKAAAAEGKESAGSKNPAADQKQQVFRCGDCQQQFSAPPEWKGEPLKCPNCGREYSKEELLA